MMELSSCTPVFCTLLAILLNDRCTWCCWQGLPCTGELFGAIWWQPRLPVGLLCVIDKGLGCQLFLVGNVSLLL
jgi:hypothetical protein